MRFKQKWQSPELHVLHAINATLQVSMGVRHRVSPFGTRAPAVPAQAADICQCQKAYFQQERYVVINQRCMIGDPF
jgi:hypothetical protein